MTDCDTNKVVQVIIILFPVLYSTSMAIYYILIIFCSRYHEDGVVIFFSEVLVNFYQSTWHHILEHVYFSNLTLLYQFILYIYIYKHTHISSANYQPPLLSQSLIMHMAALIILYSHITYAPYF